MNKKHQYIKVFPNNTGKLKYFKFYYPKYPVFSTLEGKSRF